MCDDGILFEGALNFMQVGVEGVTKGVVSGHRGGLEGDEGAKQIEGGGVREVTEEVRKNRGVGGCEVEDREGGGGGVEAGGWNLPTWRPMWAQKASKELVQ